MIDATRVYLANGFIRGACERAFWPLFFTRLVTEVELSPLQLVLLGTVFEIAIFTSEIPTGVVADLYSRRLSVILSYALGGIAIVVSAFVEPYWALIVGQALIGVASTFHSGAETAWITDELGSPEAAEEIILRRARLQIVGSVVGIGLFSLLAVITSLSTSLATAGGIFVIWSLALPFVMGEHGFTRTPGQGWRDFMAMVTLGMAQVRRVRVLRILATVIVIGGVAKEAIDRLDIQRLDDVGFPSDIDEALLVGALVAIRLLLSAALLTVAQRRIRGVSVVPAMVGMLLVTAAGIAALAHVELFAIAALGMVVQGGFHGATQPLAALWTNTFATDQARATIHSFIGQCESIGEVIGGIALGAVAEVFTVPTAMTISAILFVGSAFYARAARTAWHDPPDLIVR